MANQQKSLNARNNLIYVGFFFYGYTMPELAKAFKITKPMVFKVLQELSEANIKKLKK